MRARRHFLVTADHETKSSREKTPQDIYRADNSSRQENRNQEGHFVVYRVIHRADKSRQLVLLAPYFFAIEY